VLQCTGKSWIVLAVALLATGCTSAPPPIVAKGVAEIPAQPDAARPEGKAKLFNEVHVHLPPVAKSGNVWTVVLDDERYFKPVGGIVPEANGGAVATFVATLVGRRPIRFFAVPPKAKEAVPSQVYEVRIEIGDAR
jgi:hypothetical protein